MELVRVSNLSMPADFPVVNRNKVLKKTPKDVVVGRGEAKAMRPHSIRRQPVRNKRNLAERVNEWVASRGRAVARTLNLDSLNLDFPILGGDIYIWQDAFEMTSSA